jgi:RimJ/RimL family protein N-acetyltransferase
MLAIDRVTLSGRFVTLLPLDAERDGPALWEQSGGPANNKLWDFLSDGPFPDCRAFLSSLEAKASSTSAVFFAIVDQASQRAVGYLSLMRIEPAHHCLEVGNILYTPALQRTRGGTEAIYLIARHVFEDLRYRRLEWKCNALHQKSRRAALRYGFQFEGLFRQHMIVKGKNRDTAWFSMLDGEWPQRKANFEAWLDPANFDSDGRQLTSLSALNGVSDEPA